MKSFFIWNVGAAVVYKEVFQGFVWYEIYRYLQCGTVKKHLLKSLYPAEFFIPFFSVLGKLEYFLLFFQFCLMKCYSKVECLCH